MSGFGYYCVIELMLFFVLVSFMVIGVCEFFWWILGFFFFFDLGGNGLIISYYVCFVFYRFLFVDLRLVWCGWVSLI